MERATRRTAPDRPCLEITALAPPSRPRGLVRVRSGSRTLALLHPREAEALGLKPGRVVDERMRAELARAQARSAVRRNAERLLARRALTEAELVERLTALGGETLPVAEVVASLRRAGAIDDARVAAGAAAAWLGRGRSAAAVAARIEARGLGHDAAVQAVHAAAAANGESDWDRALALARARLERSSTTADPRTRRRRLAGVLARRGYDDDLIERVLDALLPRTADESD